jgi:urease gamma subunit
MSKIIKKLENNQQRDIKNVAQTMAIAADLVEKQKLMIEALSDLIPENATTFTSNNGKKIN